MDRKFLIQLTEPPPKYTVKKFEPIVYFLITKSKQDINTASLTKLKGSATVFDWTELYGIHQKLKKLKLFSNLEFLPIKIL